jgi:catechol 2,3-dioxygenase-like lactoylglutathione lyase family enzyme
LKKRTKKLLSVLSRTPELEGGMRRIWTIVGVADVARSARWYQTLLGLAEVAPAHDYFGQIRDDDGTVLLCLHAWEAHGHPTLTRPEDGVAGNGLLLFFRVDEFDAALAAARRLPARLEEEPHVNPATGTLEFSLRDPDGYWVTVSAADA